MARMNWDRVRRERNLIRRHYSDGELAAMPVPTRRNERRSTNRVSIPVCSVCTLMHPGEC